MGQGVSQTKAGEVCANSCPHGGDQEAEEARGHNLLKSSFSGLLPSAGPASVGPTDTTGIKVQV